MKRKLLIVFLAIVSVFCLAFGLLACDGGNGGGNTGGGLNDEQGSDGHTHEYGSWTITKQSTCSEEGARERTCSICNYTQSEKITKSDHYFNSDNVCTVCNYELEYTKGLEYEAYTENQETYYMVTGMGTATDTDLIIPAYYSGKRVTKIASSAFSGKNALTSVYITNKIYLIGKNAFYGCQNLADINLPNYRLDIRENAFAATAYYNNSKNWDKGVLYIGNHLIATNENFTATSYTLNENTLSIADKAFSGRNNLTEFIIPKESSISFIGDNALNDTGIIKAESSTFWLKYFNNTNIIDLTVNYGTIYSLSDFTNVKNLVIDCDWVDSYSWSGNEVPPLQGLVNLESLTVKWLKGGVRSYSLGSLFGETEYVGCIAVDSKMNLYGDYSTYYVPSSLKSVTVLQGKIPEYAFYNCTMIESITIGQKVKEIEKNAFSNCTSLTRTNYLGSIADWCALSFASADSNPLSFSHNFYIDNEQVTQVIIPDGVTYIESGAFIGFSSLTSITIPDSVTSIGSGAFADCSSLKSITIPDNITTIEYNLFGGCTSLTSITIPDSVTSIGEDAFKGCSSLTSVTIGNGVTSIGDYAFYYCSSLESVTIPDSVTSIGGHAFSKCSSLTSITIPDSVTSIGGHAFSKCSSLTSITIPDSVTSIGDYAFWYCNGLTSVTIPDSVTSIGSGAFKGCSSLTSITIPDSVTSIGESAFQACIGLTSVTIPESVTSIGESAFDGCSGLTSLTIGNGVTSIGAWAYQNCYKLIEVKNLSSLTITAGSSSNGYVGYYAKRIYTEGESYLSTDENGYIIYDDGTDKILIAYVGTEKELTLPNGITRIYGYAFRNCSSLTSITIPDSVTSIGEYAFYECTKLTSITIPDSIKNIADDAFRNCSSLTSITIPDSVTSIGEYAFYECTKLTSITIPDSVTSIGAGTFSDCSGLTSVTIGNGVISINYYAFNGCSSLTSITFNGTMAEWKVISKGYNWNHGTGTYTVTCTDGTLDKDGNVVS